MEGKRAGMSKLIPIVELSAWYAWQTTFQLPKLLNSSVVTERVILASSGNLRYQ